MIKLKTYLFDQNIIRRVSIRLPDWIKEWWKKSWFTWTWLKPQPNSTKPLPI